MPRPKGRQLPHRISVALTDEQHAGLDELARANGAAVSVRLAVTEFLGPECPGRGTRQTPGAAPGEEGRGRMTLTDREKEQLKAMIDAGRWAQRHTFATSRLDAVQRIGQPLQGQDHLRAIAAAVVSRGEPRADQDEDQAPAFRGMADTLVAGTSPRLPNAARIVSAT